MNQRIFILFIFLIFSSSVVYGQLDTLNKPTETATVKKAIKPIIKKTVIVPIIINVDSLRKDSLLKAQIKNSLIADSILFVQKKNIFLKDSLNKTAYSQVYINPLLGLDKKPINRLMSEREFESKDYLFYLFTGLFFLLALFRFAFQQYFNNIFRIFVQPSFRQLQTKDQMLQNLLPSICFNLFFLIIVSIYITFIIQFFSISSLGFWQLNLYSFAIVTVIYIGKYLLLQFSGWVFAIKPAIKTYIFIIFLLNKFLGIILFPMVVLIAFSTLQLQQILFTTSFILLVLVYLYRFVISYKPINRDIKMNPLHFLFFIIAFEIAPMFLLYKVLMNFFS